MSNMVSEVGFPNPVKQNQQTFRLVLEAMSEPGREHPFNLEIGAPDLLYPATAALLLALTDYDTPLWLSGSLASVTVSNYLKFHCGAPIVDDPAQAGFAVANVSDPLPSLHAFNLGTDEYPDQSTTVILQVDRLMTGVGSSLRGPGIQGSTELELSCLPGPWQQQRRELQPLYPQGIDMVFTTGKSLAALPRSTMIEA